MSKQRISPIVLTLAGLAILLAGCSQTPAAPSWTTAYQQGFEGSATALPVTDISVPNNACSMQPTMSDASAAIASGGYNSSHAEALNVNIQHTPALYMIANVWHKLTTIQSLNTKRNYALSADVKVDTGSNAGVLDLGIYMATGTANGSHGYWGAFQWVLNPYDPTNFGSMRVVRSGGATDFLNLKPDSKWHHVRIEFSYDPSSGLSITSATLDGTTYPINQPAVLSTDTSSSTPYMGFAFDTLNAYTNCSTSNDFYGTTYWDNLEVQTRAAP